MSLFSGSSKLHMTNQFGLLADELSRFQQKFSDTMSPESLSDVSLILKIYQKILFREIDRNMNEPYNPAISMPGRAQHNIDLKLLLRDWVERVDPPSLSPIPSSAKPSLITPGTSSTSDNRDAGSSRHSRKGKSRSTSSGSSVPFSCLHPDCQADPPKFQYQSKLKDHQLKHDPPSFQCPSCSKRCTYRRVLKKHIERKHQSGESIASSQTTADRAWLHEPKFVGPYKSQEPADMKLQWPIYEPPSIPIDPQLGALEGTVDPKVLELKRDLQIFNGGSQPLP